MFAGYSSVTPSLWAMAGYSEMVLRYEGNATMRAQWEAARHFEYVWHASGSLSYNRSSIFAHVINGNYGDLCGQGFDWEHPNTTKNPPVTPDNVQSRATLFSAYIRAQAQSYRGPPFMLLWGADFHFHNSPVQFGNMSALVREINAHPATYGLRVRYSTATEYFNALHSSSSTSFPLVHNNVNFELGWPHKISGYSAPLTYQTGTASSWPQYKQRVRACAALMRATDALLAFITDTLTPTDCNQLTHVHQALALVQVREKCDCATQFKLLFLPLLCSIMTAFRAPCAPRSLATPRFTLAMKMCCPTTSSTCQTQCVSLCTLSSRLPSRVSLTVI